MDAALQTAMEELRAVHEAALRLATAMREFGREAELVAALMRELEAA